MRLITLGDLRLEGSELTRPTPLLLLAYLRLEGRRSRRVLAELFFADTSDPRDSLSNVVRRIIREAPGALAEDGATLAASGFACDALELLAAHDDPERAAALHRGPFLAGLELGLGVELEEWVFETREALAREVRDAHQRLASTASALGDAERVRRHRERAAELAEATGIEPPSELQASSAPFPASGDADLPGAGHVLLPPLRTRFVGREQELEALLARLRDPATRILTLYGIGGIGKSRLAEQLARRAAAAAFGEFRDGAAFIALDAVESAAELAQAVARACDVTQSQAQGLGDLGVALADRHLLLVLDNFEQLLPQATEVAELVDECQYITVVVTSRERLDLAGELTHAVNGLATRSADDGLSDAENLFAERAARARRAPLTPDERADARRICTLVGGHPLALELAAGMARALPVAAIARELERSLGLLRGGPRDAPSRHYSVHAALEGSWARLSTLERELLARVAVFDGGFSHDAATAVASAGPTTLLRLSDRALVTLTTHDRYHLHPLSRVFVREAAADADDLTRAVEQASDAHLRYFAALLRDSTTHATDNPSYALKRIDDDLANILRAIKRALDVEPEAGLDLLHDLVVRCKFLSSRGRHPLLMDLIHQGIEIAGSFPLLEHAYHLNAEVASVYRQIDGDLERALAFYQEALQCAERLENLEFQALMHGALALVESRRGSPTRAEHLGRAFDLAKRSRSQFAECRVFQNASFIAYTEQRWTAMERFALRSVELGEALRHEVRDARLNQTLYFALHNVGAAVHWQGRYAEARAYYERALAHARDCQNRLWEAFAADELGDVHNDLEARDDASRWYGLARELYRALGARRPLEILEKRMVVQRYLPDPIAQPS